VYSVNLVFEHWERQLGLEFTAKLHSSGASWGIDNFILRFNKTGPESSGNDLQSNLFFYKKLEKNLIFLIDLKKNSWNQD
jgi:hypothetical protein